jgi:hypothetical protein
MKLARVLCFLIILGSSAIAAYAQTPIAPSSLNGDAHVHLNDPICSDPICVALVVTGTSTHHVDSLFFPAVEGGTYTPPLLCDTNIEGWECDVKFNGDHDSDDTFLGFSFHPREDDGESLTGGLALDFSSNIPILLGQSNNTACVPASACSNGVLAPLFILTPEPSSSLLFTTGLLLFSLVGFVRKRLGANFPT